MPIAREPKKGKCYMGPLNVCIKNTKHCISVHPIWRESYRKRSVKPAQSFNHANTDKVKKDNKDRKGKTGTNKVKVVRTAKKVKGISSKVKVKRVKEDRTARMAEMELMVMKIRMMAMVKVAMKNRMQNCIKYTSVSNNYVKLWKIVLLKMVK